MKLYLKIFHCPGFRLAFLVLKVIDYHPQQTNKDIAFEFASWVSIEFKLYLIKEFQRLKEEEQKQFGGSAKRELVKINYHIHTDAIKEHLIPSEITPLKASIIYASEADVLNVALFGKTAKQWREENPDMKGNMRDYAHINELIWYTVRRMLRKKSGYHKPWLFIKKICTPYVNIVYL